MSYRARRRRFNLIAIHAGVNERSQIRRPDARTFERPPRGRSGALKVCVDRFPPPPLADSG